MTDLGEAIDATAWVDTHEHLVEEHWRLPPDGRELVVAATGERFSIPPDWSVLLSGYALGDLVGAGLPPDVAPELRGTAWSPLEKWDAVEPYFLAARNTAFLRVADLSAQRLCGLRLARETVEEIDARLRALRVPGFYEHVLRDVANVAHCHVHSSEADPFCETDLPELLRQDLALSPPTAAPREECSGLVFGRHPAMEQASGIEVGSLDDYLRTVEWCFARFAPRAVAVKCAWAYQRPLACELPSSPPRRAFERLRAATATPAEVLQVESFLLQRCIELATEAGLPVKLHLGQLATANLPTYRHVFDHVRDVVSIVQANPSATFVLMHIAWPHQEQLLAVAKHHPNAMIDFCWAWSLAPRAAQELLERALTVLPASRLLCFGGDDGCVENVVGHAELARRGLQAALEASVARGWLTAAEALALVPVLMHGNAERVFPRRVVG